jgi:hypothetical protein
MGIGLMPAMPPIASEADGAGLPMTIVSWISTIFATGLDAPTSASVAERVFLIVMYAVPDPTPAGLARTHGSLTVIEALPLDKRALTRSAAAAMTANSPPRRTKRALRARVFRTPPAGVKRGVYRTLDGRVPGSENGPDQLGDEVRSRPVEDVVAQHSVGSDQVDVGAVVHVVVAGRVRGKLRVRDAPRPRLLR